MKISPKFPMHIRTRCNLVLSFVIAVVAVMPLSASVLLQDTFDYPLGNAVGSNGGAGFSAGWTGVTTNGRLYTVSSGTFSPPIGYSYETSGGKYVAVTAGTAAANFGRTVSNAIDFNPVEQTTLYFSVLVSRLTDGASGGDSLIRLLDSSNLAIASFGITGSASTGEKIRIGNSVSGNVTGTTNVVTGGATFDTAPQYLLIGKLVLNAAGTSDVLSLSIVNAAGTVSIAEPETWGLTQSADISGIATQLAIYTGANTGTFNADNFVLGSTYADVVPEPATYVLIWGGLVCLGVGRRWRMACL